MAESTNILIGSLKWRLLSPGQRNPSARALHRCLALPAPILALVSLVLGFDQSVAEHSAVDRGRDQHRGHATLPRFENQPARTPARVRAMQLADQRLNLSRHALRAGQWSPRTVLQPSQATLFQAQLPVVTDYRDAPYRAATSRTAVPCCTSSTAR